MAIKKENIKYLLIGAIILIILGAQNTLPKRAVADVEGKACITNKDCPCWGKLNDGAKAYGVGMSSCRTDIKTCDTSLCLDVQPVGTYLKNNPFQWVKDNIVLTIGIVALLVSVAMWPKQ